MPSGVSMRYSRVYNVLRNTAVQARALKLRAQLQNERRQTLAVSYRVDPLRTAREVEALTGSRMDHQLHLDADLFATVVDTLGGLEVRQGQLTGSQVADFLSGDPRGRSGRTADLLRAALARASMGSALTDPARFDKVMKALVPCLTVDSGLTTDVIRDTMMESRVQADEIVSWPLASKSSPGGAVADPSDLVGLRTALAGDSFPPANTMNKSPLPSPSATR